MLSTESSYAMLLHCEVEGPDTLQDEFVALTGSAPTWNQLLSKATGTNFLGESGCAPQTRRPPTWWRNIATKTTRTTMAEDTLTLQGSPCSQMHDQDLWAGGGAHQWIGELLTLCCGWLLPLCLQTCAPEAHSHSVGCCSWSPPCRSGCLPEVHTQAVCWHWKSPV